MKYVYSFGDGTADGKADMKTLLGGKGANLAEMNLLNIPVDWENEKLHYILNKDPNMKYVHYVEHSWLDKRKNGGLMNDGSLPHDEKK